MVSKGTAAGVAIVLGVGGVLAALGLQRAMAAPQKFRITLTATTTRIPEGSSVARVTEDSRFGSLPKWNPNMLLHHSGSNLLYWRRRLYQ